VLDAAVQALVEGGTLTPQRGRPLLDALGRERRAMAAGDVRNVAGPLTSYVRRVDALVRKGSLTPEQGQALALPARAIVESVGTGTRGRIFPTGSSGVARGDFNHDGFGDLAVGAPDQPVDGRAGAGAVYVLYGTAGGLSAVGAATWTEDTAGMTQRAARNDRFGSSLASGDFDGDGFTDLAVGAPGAAAGAGRVGVLFGSSSGLTAERTETLDIRDVDAALPRGAGWNFGAALAWGDLDGDGFGDLAVGVPGMDRDVPRPGAPAERVLVRHAGLVCVFFGSTDGLLAQGGAAARAPQTVAPSGTSVAAGLDPDPANAGDRFGSALAAGKFDADRFADLAIGSPYADVTLPTGAEGGAVHLPDETVFLDAGRVHLAFGSATGLDLDGARVRTITEDTFLDAGVAGQPGRSDWVDRFGSALSAGDFDGDGIAGLAIGAPFRDSVDGAGVRIRDAGAVYVIAADGPGGLDTPRLQVLTQGGSLGETREADDRFGSAVSFGDFDADGRKDLAVGVPLEDLVDGRDATLRDCGVVHVVHGSPAGLDPARSQILRRAGEFADAAIVVGTDLARSGDRFGAALTAWNFNGVPSPADLAVGVPGADAARRPDAGAVQVVYGTGTGLSGTGAQTWRPGNLGFGDRTRAHFGASLY
jgi:hypothetical protein